jgi:hypothetical protein
LGYVKGIWEIVWKLRVPEENRRLPSLAGGKRRPLEGYGFIMVGMKMRYHGTVVVNVELSDFIASQADVIVTVTTT